MAALDRVLALAVVRVPNYTRESDRGTPVRVNGYQRMGPDAMAEHLTSSHGMAASQQAGGFAHPTSLDGWHSMDHLAHGGSLDHVHDSAAHDAEHAGGAHLHAPGSHLGSLIGHHAVREGPLVAHREIRREADRQTRRRLFHAVHGHGARARKPGGASAGGAGSGGSGSGNSGGGSGSGSSSGSGGNRNSRW
jgi:uncharacterized membrane protein YgcG